MILASGADNGSEAVLFYLAAYAPALLSALCVAALLGQSATLDDLTGLIWRRPLAGAALAVALLSLAGLPTAVGFLAKYFLFLALIPAEAWILLAVAAAGSAVGIDFYGRFAAAIFRQPSHEGGTPTAQAPMHQ